MKWIGQQIYDLTSRFRNDVYLEDISTGTIASGAHLGLDSNNKIVKAVDGGGDLTGITAGTGLSGTNLTGPVPTLNVDFPIASANLDADTAHLTTAQTFTGSKTMGTDVKLNFRDANSYIYSPTANDLEIVATDITLDAATVIELEQNTNVGGNLTVNHATGVAISATNRAASASNTGGVLNLISNDGAACGDDHRLGKLGFQAAEDAAGTIRQGASIAAFADAAWSDTENGTRLEFYTMDGNNASELSLKLDSDLLATFSGAVTVTGALTGTLATASQTNITSLGTLTALTVDNIGINGDTITASADLAIVATGNDITVDTDHFVIESAATADPTLTLKSTTNSNVGSSLEFISDKGAAGADNDVIGSIKFIGDDTAQTQTQFARIVGSVSESTDSDEAGKLQFFVAESNGTSTSSNTVGLLIEGEHATDGQIDVTIAAGAASTTTVAGTLTMGSTATINNSGVVQVAAQTVIDHDQLANFAAGEHFTQANITTVGTIGTGVWNGTAIAHAYIGADAIEGDNLADDAVDSEHYTDGSIDTAHIADDQVTFAKAIGVSPKVFGSTIKILPSDFMSNDDGGSTKFGIGFVEADGTGFGMKIPNAGTELLAFVSIPEGMKATHVDIFDQADDRAIEVFEANVNSRTITSKGSGNCNTTLDITDVNATAVNYLLILVTTTATSDRVYGGTVTIAAQ